MQFLIYHGLGLAYVKMRCWPRKKKKKGKKKFRLKKKVEKKKNPTSADHNLLWALKLECTPRTLFCPLVNHLQVVHVNFSFNTWHHSRCYNSMHEDGAWKGCPKHFLSLKKSLPIQEPASNNDKENYFIYIWNNFFSSIPNFKKVFFNDQVTGANYTCCICRGWSTRGTPGKQIYLWREKIQHITFSYACAPHMLIIPLGSPARGGDVMVYACDIN